MALANFSLPFAGATTQNWAATISPLQPHYATAVNNLLYGPAGHQQETDESSARHQDYYKNDPYAPPQNHQFRPRTNNNYLPPPPPPSSHPNQQHHHHQHHHSRDQQYNNNGGHPTYNNPATGYGDGRYSHVPTRSSKSNTPQYFNGYNTQTRTYEGEQTISVRPTTEATPPTGNSNGGESGESGSADSSETGGGYPERLPGYTRVQAGGQGSKTQVHAVLDYDAEEDEEGDYYEDRDGNSNNSDSTVPTVTPIQGPIFLKNGTVPVVPLFSYPTIKNGTFVQIPIWWTALSVALGLDVRGDIIRGVPCVKRHHQLFCPTAGNSYPIERIEQFIDDNKALMRRMYGDFEMTSQFGGQRRKRKRSIDEPDFADLQDAPSEDYDFFSDLEEGDTYFGKWRQKRQSTPSFRNNNNNGQNNPRNQNSKPPNRRGPGSNPETENSTGRVDVCESKIEIVTPYWASNSAGKIRAIVNTQHFEQAIHQEICTKPQTGRCGKDCGCEQKYKWHRLLAYDPDNDCKGIFMDWFLFPSCCVCRCSPT